MPGIAGPLVSRPVFSRHGIFFWLFRNVVRVRYSFFLVILLLGARRHGVASLAVWLGVATLAILLHELGHAGAARAFGSAPAIELYGMGGLTSWSWARRPRCWERVAASLAGPGMGFAAGGLAWGLAYAFGLDDAPYLLRLAVRDFLWVSIAWGLFNPPADPSLGRRFGPGGGPRTLPRRGPSPLQRTARVRRGGWPRRPRGPRQRPHLGRGPVRLVRLQQRLALRGLQGVGLLG